MPSPNPSRLPPVDDEDSPLTATVQLAERQHLAAIAALRWERSVEVGRPLDTQRRDFIDAFGRWMQRNADTHRCLVVTVEGTVVGTGFVALTERVPIPRQGRRISADIQAVFVKPEYRNAGIGHRLITALVELAAEHNAEHITVHSSQRAVHAYERAGFRLGPRHLHRSLADN
jgi:GNAT superfamily N-acetyltransferase